MRKIIALLLIAIISLACKKDDYKNLTSILETKQILNQNYILFSKEVKKLDDLVQKNSDIKSIQIQFKKARLYYKKIESFVAFYLPETTKNINGAAINKNDVEDAGRKVEYATGFQKVEELLFSNQIDFKELRTQIEILNGFSQSLKTNIKNIELTDSNIFESQKLQMVRIMSLGISGFDSPIALHSLQEAKASIESIQSVIYKFKEDSILKNLVDRSILFIANKDFNTFDRAEFITKYCIPISKRINEIQKELQIKNNPNYGPINFEYATIFEEGAFNVNYFAPSYNKNPSLDQILLGEKLFADSILSGDDSVSCTTCHVPSEAYADHKIKAVESTTISRNTPTLLNSGLQNTLFLDGRVNYLEDQAKAVINNKDEMHGSFSKALEKIKNNKSYQSEFRKAFPSEKEITEQNLLKSIASYVRSLSKLNSKFDEYLRGKTKLSINEKRGFNTFMGKGKCATCHFFPLFNGSVPPMYNELESEVLGVPIQKEIKNAKIDPDLGEYEITKASLKKYAFKTPTIRNSAITFPYMHNGVYNSLEEVIDFYNKGGGSGIGIHLENQTLPKDELHLTETEINDLITFLKTLNNKY